MLGQSVGERLRVAREAKKLSLDDVARQTRIPVRHLEHIEREEWDALPAITYSVGFARSYANVVDLDGAQIGAEVRQLLGGEWTRHGDRYVDHPHSFECLHQYSCRVVTVVRPPPVSARRPRSWPGISSPPGDCDR